MIARAGAALPLKERKRGCGVQRAALVVLALLAAGAAATNYFTARALWLRRARPFESILCAADSAGAWVTARLMGGLGNQLFQVAAAAALAHREGACVFFAASDFSPRDAALRDSPMLSKFPRTAPTAGPGARVHAVDVPLFAFAELPSVAQLAEGGDPGHVRVELRGYAQNSAYWAASAPSLRRLLQPPRRVTSELRRTFPHLAGAVGIHMRFGDKLGGALYPALDYAYYSKAYTLVLGTAGGGAAVKHNRPPVVYVATDDVSTANQSAFLRSLTGAVRFLPADPTTALWALSLCGRGIITASSTFSWWAAYLRISERTPVVMPRSAFLPNEPDFPGGYFPDAFAVIDSNGTMLRSFSVL